MQFDELSESLLVALKEPERRRRVRAVDKWKTDAVSHLKKAVPQVLDAHIDEMMGMLAVPRNWETMEQKWRLGIYRLSMDINFHRIAKKEVPHDATPSITESYWEDEGNHQAVERSPNDNRSDSMNPNNPAHKAAADNRSNQMNPNNPAHPLSRGEGKGG